MAEALRTSYGDPDGHLAQSGELWRYGIEDLERLPFSGEGIWRQIGPAPLLIGREQTTQGIGPDSGEVVDIAIDPTGGDNVNIYIATNNGGVWKSTNGGSSWKPMSDFLPGISIGAVALDPGDPQIVYAGSGNLFDGATGLTRPLGLFKSVDGGVTWAHMDGGPRASVLADKGIIRIVCPAPNAVLVATGSPIEKSGPTVSGLFFSKNGGVTFGANHPDYDDGQPVHTGFISALIPDNNSIGVRQITDATGPAPMAITAPAHGFQSGDRVYIGGVFPTASANGSWLVDPTGPDTFTLRGSITPGNGANGGFAVGPAHPKTLAVQGADNTGAAKVIVIQSAGHGLVTGDIVAIHGVLGNTNANGSWPIKVTDADHFELAGPHGNAAYLSDGIIDAPQHRTVTITAAANAGSTVRITAAGHGLVATDQVTLDGLPGINVPKNSAIVLAVNGDTFTVGGLKMNAAYSGGGSVTGPAAAWNSVYFGCAGPKDAGRGLFRLTLCSDGGLAKSDNLMSHTGSPFSGAKKFGKVVVAQSMKPRPRTLYLSVQNEFTYVGFFVSNNAGKSWTAQTQLAERFKIDQNSKGQDQSSYAMTVGVDPQDSNRVYAALRHVWRSVNGGVNWIPVIAATLGGNQADALGGGFKFTAKSPGTCQIHDDHHAMAFVPPTQWPQAVSGQPSKTPVYFGTDGGMSRSTDGATTYDQLNEGLATGLFRDIDIGRGAGNNAVTYGGTQDLGTLGHRTVDAELCWSVPSPGDGDYTAVDPADPRIVFGFQNDLLLWTPSGGDAWFSSSFDVRPLITEVRNTDPIEIVTTGHPFQDKDTVVIQGVGTKAFPNGAAKIIKIDNFRFKLKDKNASTLPPFPLPTATGGRFLRSIRIASVQRTKPIVVETAAPHGFATDDQVFVEKVLGLNFANNSDTDPFWKITVIDNTHFSLNDQDGTQAGFYVPGSGRVRGPRTLGSVPVQLATRATPIVVTAIDHGFVSGDSVTVANVRGTTDANTTAVITVIDNNSFILRGTQGKADFIPGPQAIGKSISRGMSSEASLHRVAIVPNAAPPLMFVSRSEELFSSVDGGFNFSKVAGTPWGKRRITALAAPASDQLWIATTITGDEKKGEVLELGRLDFRGGTPLHWFDAKDNFVKDIGSVGLIWAIAVDPSDALHIAVVVSGFSATHIQRRTRHCYITTTGGRTDGATKAWTEVGGAFGAPTGNLPDLPLFSAAWDTSGGKSTLLVASDAGVLRLVTDHWERVGPNLPNVTCVALRVDNSANPNVIRVGTYGRSAWELDRPTGPKLAVRGQPGFGERRVGTDSRLPLILHNVGAAQVNIAQLVASGDFSFDPPAPFPLGPHASKAINVLFHPSAAGPRGGSLKIVSDDPANPQIFVPATGIGVTAGKGRLSVRRRLDFGVVAVGAVVTAPLEIANTGLDTLNLTVLKLDDGGNPAFSLPGAPTVSDASPLPLAPGEVRTIGVRFAPTAAGAKVAPLLRKLLVGPAAPGVEVALSGVPVAAGSGNLIASVTHFAGLDDGESSPDVVT